jgi:hypothetical protein
LNKWQVAQLRFNRYFALQSIRTSLCDRGGIAAAGDIGDLAFMMPCIQISYGGFEGTIHGDDFKMIDPEFVLETFPEFLSEVLSLYSLNERR